MTSVRVEILPLPEPYTLNTLLALFRGVLQRSRSDLKRVIYDHPTKRVLVERKESVELTGLSAYELIRQYADIEEIVQKDFSFRDLVFLVAKLRETRSLLGIVVSNAAVLSHLTDGSGIKDLGLVFGCAVYEDSRVPKGFLLAGSDSDGDSIADVTFSYLVRVPHE